MRRFLLIMLAAMAASVFFLPTASAGSPHFVGDPTVTRSGNTLTVQGKEAGLGDEDQITVVVSADAACLNPGQNFPSAGNKQTFTTSADVPVQNGKANFTLKLTATFQPKCSPPMTVVFGDVTVTDTTNNLTVTIPGPF